MKDALMKSSLTVAQKQLVQLLRRVNYGRLEDLLIRDGQPSFNPPPVVIRKIRIPGDTGPRRELQTGDFVLKKKLFQLLWE